MPTFRSIFAGLALVALSAQTAAAAPVEAKLNINAAQNGVAQIDQRVEIAPVTPEKVAFLNGFKPGAVIVDTAARKLYFTLSASEAYVYPVAVGKPGFAWAGVETVTRFADWPQWTPPAEMRQRNPNLPATMPGGLKNPLGAKAIYLGATEYRIHGTNKPASIGSAASSGCIRMLNGHVVHLAGLLTRGSKVFVMESLPSDAPAMPPEVVASAKIIEVAQAAAVQIAAR